MGNAARKARKAAGEPFTKAQKKPTKPYARKREQIGFGLVEKPEMMAAALVAGRMLWDRATARR